MKIKKVLFILLILVCIGVIVYFVFQYFNTSKQVYEGVLVFRENMKNQVYFQI